MASASDRAHQNSDKFQSSKLTRKEIEAFIWTSKTETTYDSFLMEKAPCCCALTGLKGCPESKLLIGPSSPSAIFFSIVPEMFGSSSLLLRLFEAYKIEHAAQQAAQYKQGSRRMFPSMRTLCVRKARCLYPSKYPQTMIAAPHNNSRAAVMTANHKSSNYWMPFCTQGWLAKHQNNFLDSCIYRLQAKVSTSTSHQWIA